MLTTRTQVASVLTRTGGFLRTVASHSLQPYRGCPYGSALCGVACYVRHNIHVTRGRPWGSFLEVRTNAAESYLRTAPRERAWARRQERPFAIFLSSSTEPFPPQEKRLGITQSVLRAMLDEPPDALILQTHSPQVADSAALLRELGRVTDLRVHLSIETDRDRIPGLPPHATSVEARFQAAAQLKAAGLRVVITVAPLLPIADPDAFFARISQTADAVVLDHYIGGDGSPDGSRTQRTGLPAALAAIEPAALDLTYRDQMAAIARQHMPGRVSVHIDGFAGRGWG